MLPGTGVVVGRWQVPFLHAGHEAIIDAADRHQRLIVFVGVAGTLNTQENPLDFPTRRAMIQGKYPAAIVLPILEQPSDEVWSKNLDHAIGTVSPLGPVMLYAGRDSFLPHYKGHFIHTKIEPVTEVNGTELRAESSQAVTNTRDFRAGVIYASNNRYPSVFPTVDVACIRRKSEVGEVEVLLGQKRNQPGKWRFPGGFVSLSDESYAFAARRELLEETGILIEPEHIEIIESGIRAQDWRSSASSGIFTTFFLAHYMSGQAKASDDLDHVEWFKLPLSSTTQFTDGHKKLFDLLLVHLKKKGY